MSEIRHTPTPWRTTKRQPNVICNEGGDKWIARATIGHSPSPRFIGDADFAAANAAFIVTAVNAYDKHRSLIETLVVALKHSGELLEYGGFDLDYLNIALAASKEISE